jgi:tRNA 2-selenouridine synthase
MHKINFEDTIGKRFIFIDTRSPKEFALDNIKGSLNIPILDNKERAEVGILYKHDPDKALELGLQYYENKLPKLTKDIRKINPKDKVVVYCARGGLRSQTVTKLIEGLGYDVHQLEGGYKKYRAYLREFFCSFEPDFRFVVIYGLAGCGKTRLMKELSPSIDLEGMAAHRSSLFGAIGLKPHTQKRFETLLFDRLNALKYEKYVYVEGESRKIGDLFIPDKVFAAMKKGIGIHLTCGMEKRCRFIVEDYFTHNEDAEIISIIDKLRQPLTNETADQLIEKVKEKDYMFVSQVLLEKYYDSRYAHYINSIKIDTTIDNDEHCVDKIKKFIAYY